MRLRSWKLYVPAEVAVIGFRRSSTSRAPCFHALGQYSLPTVPLIAFASRFILPCSLSSSEFLRSESRLQSFRRRLPAWVSSLFATPPERVHSPRGFPSPRYVPSSGALSLSTFYSALRLAGLFHPAATFRALLVQGLLSRRSHPSSSEGAPPSSLVTRRSPAEADARDALPRPRGLSPRRAASRSFGG